MLDIDHGTYPTVTSTNSTAGGIYTGLGIPPKQVDQVIGVAKATESRVGDGPFPTEDSYFNVYREGWNEFGATTRRPRRLGWRDGAQLKYAARLNGVDYIALTCLDRLGDVPDRLKICVGYKIDGRETDEWPTGFRDQTVAKPIYRDLDGWHGQDISSARDFNDLPKAAQNYVRELEKEADCYIGMISVGKERGDIIQV